MYKELARYYDLIYMWKDYKIESKRIRDIIRKYKKSDSNSLLEVACGTGRHLEYLRRGFSCTGLDLNEEMLKLARKRLSGVKLIRGNMIDFRLGSKFDVVTCLFSSIGYVKTYENLEKTLRNFSKHLRVGGIVIIEPWFTKAEYKVGTPHMTVYQGKDIKIARANVSIAKNGVSILEMHHLIAEKGKEMKHFVSVEELGMFETPKTLQLMRRAGFDAKFIKGMAWDERRGIFVGVKL